nr:terminase [uncultured Pseudomonas sp.]
MARKTLWDDGMAGFAKDLCLLGATDVDLAKHFEVSINTIYNWKKKHLSFRMAVKEGRFIADSKVAASLFQRAVGYSMEETDVRVIDKKVVLTKYTKNFPPDTAACMFILQNRNKELWRVKQEFEHSGAIKTSDLSDEQLAAKAERLKEEVSRMASVSTALPGDAKGDAP